MGGVLVGFFFWNVGEGSVFGAWEEHLRTAHVRFDQARLAPLEMTVYAVGGQREIAAPHALAHARLSHSHRRQDKATAPHS